MKTRTAAIFCRRGAICQGNGYATALDRISAFGHRGRSPFRGCERTAQRAAKQLLGVLRNNRNDLIDDQRTRIAGRRISLASAQPVMNHLINRRMPKRQQVRWNCASAHRMLMVRLGLLEGGLENHFRRRYPGLR
jgi:hypothetical protein